MIDILNIIDERYPVDASIMLELERKRVQEARECHHTAMQLRKHGYPAIAAWESSVARKLIVEARIARNCRI